MLGYAPEMGEGGSRPSMPWEKTGFLLVKKPGPKITTLKIMAAEIVKARQKEALQVEAKPARR